MSQPDLTSLSDEELTERRKEAMAAEDEAVKAEEDSARQASDLTQGEIPVMSMRELKQRAIATESARQCRLAIEAEEQRRRGRSSR